MIVVAVLAVLGAIECWIGRIELGDRELRVVELFRRRRYARESIESVKWERGGPVALRLHDQTWAGLPSTGYSNAKVAGALRAWLNQKPAGVEESL